MKQKTALRRRKRGDFPGGPVADTLCFQHKGSGVQSLVREIDRTYCS